MNWDISIGHLRQLAGRVFQRVGRRTGSRRTTLNGEALEYAGRLQMRYGTLKHQAQWGNPALHRVVLQPVARRPVRNSGA